MCLNTPTSFTLGLLSDCLNHKTCHDRCHLQWHNSVMLTLIFSSDNFSCHVSPFPHDNKLAFYKQVQQHRTTESMSSVTQDCTSLIRKAQHVFWVFLVEITSQFLFLYLSSCVYNSHEVTPNAYKEHGSLITAMILHAMIARIQLKVILAFSLPLCLAVNGHIFDELLVHLRCQSQSSFIVKFFTCQDIQRNR